VWPRLSAGKRTDLGRADVAAGSTARGLSFSDEGPGKWGFGDAMNEVPAGMRWPVVPEQGVHTAEALGIVVRLVNIKRSAAKPP
jgi:hypothetical protein